MKIKLSVLNDLGLYESEVMEVTQKELEAIRNLLCKLHDVNYFSMTNGATEFYFPSNIIQNSIVQLVTVSA